MDPLDRLLRDDLNRLLDRIAQASFEDGGAVTLGPDAGLQILMDQAEASLSGLRLRLLDDYEEWRRAMDACERLWALWRLRAGGTAEPALPREIEVLRAA